jgi:hypothetical protein
MIDVDSELDARLRSFYEHIEEQQPPRGFESFEAPRRSRSRRTVNLVVGIAGVAVVAAGVTVFATQLASHHNAKPPVAATAPALPTNAQLTLSLPSISHTVIKVTRGHGSASLPTFTPQGIIFMLTACVGAGSYSVISVDHQVGMGAASCDAGAIAGQTVPADTSIDGKPLTLEISAEPSTVWEIVVADSGPVAPLPLLGASTIPAGAHILVPATDGTGTSGVETISIPAGPYFVQYTCVGTGTIAFSASDTDQTAPFASAPCANGAIGTVEAARQPGPGIMDLTVETPQHTYWEVQVYELPAQKS